jgi:hypothetical protein
LSRWRLSDILIDFQRPFVVNLTAGDGTEGIFMKKNHFMSQIMTQLKAYLFLAFSAPLFFACNGNTGNSATTTGTPDNKATAPATTTGDASFSAVIDGQAVSGKGTDELQLKNTAFIYPAQGSNDKYILFNLLSDKNGEDFYGFRFYSPDKEGEFNVANAKKEGYRCSIRLDFNLRSTDNFAIYTGDSVAVNIRSITASGISGTFSGEFKLSDLSRSKPYKMQITITDGKFDIPFSTGNIRPE